VLPEKPRLGQNFYFLIREVREKLEKDSPQIVLTRQDDLFLRKLLELEIPEIKEGIIIIRQILRIPGLLSKLVVESKRTGLDPLGTCLGKDAERIRTICRLIYPERLDIVPWSEDKKQLLFNFLSPAKVVSLTERGND
jgi:transcription termination/antitermination protein NusA